VSIAALAFHPLLLISTIRFRVEFNCSTGTHLTLPSTDPRAPVFSARRTLLALVAFFVLFYLADFAWYELRVLVPKLGAATGSVHRIRLLAISSKGNKIEYEIDSVHPEEDVPCSHSVFPHGGNRPCWYMIRHANDPIPM